MKQRNNIKRIISLMLIVFQVKFAGMISNIVNLNGVTNYNNLIENFTDLLEEQNITDPQHIYEYFNYALWNGYLSKDHELKYSINRKVYLDNPGMSIASGNAVCLNYADMLACIYRKLGFNSYIAMCYVDGNIANIEKIRTDANIERKISSGDDERLDAIFNNVIVDNITRLLGNHAITCVEYKGEVYIYDPTNLIYLDKTGFNDINIVNGSGKFDLRYFTSLFYENINLFKVIPCTNNKNYKLEVVSKPELIIDIESLENFYNKNEELINKIDKSNKMGTKSGVVEILIYGILASSLIMCYKKLIKEFALNCKNLDIDDIKIISGKLKEYFKQHNINTEYEVLKNYELITKKLGIKNSLCKDLLRKSILCINNLMGGEIFYNNILVVLLDELGYDSSVCYVKKYVNSLPTGNIVLIQYKKGNINYYYDPEIGELLYEDDKNTLHSKNKKYKYKKTSKLYSFDSLYNKEDIENKMNEENNLLSKNELNELRKSKILRKDY